MTKDKGIYQQRRFDYPRYVLYDKGLGL